MRDLKHAFLLSFVLGFSAAGIAQVAYGSHLVETVVTTDQEAAAMLIASTSGDEYATSTRLDASDSTISEYSSSTIQSAPIEKLVELPIEVDDNLDTNEDDGDDERKIEDVAYPHATPYYSQIDDISDPEWKGVSCGIAAMAMLIDYYAEAVAPDVLLAEGRTAGAFDNTVGWSHQGLINLATKRGLDSYSHTMGHLTMEQAFIELEQAVQEGPVMVSVQYTFVPTNPIPHLVVVNGITDGMVHYSDPADGMGSITVEQFQSTWKKRYIAVRPQ